MLIKIVEFNLTECYPFSNRFTLANKIFHRLHLDKWKKPFIFAPACIFYVTSTLYFFHSATAGRFSLLAAAQSALGGWGGLPFLFDSPHFFTSLWKAGLWRVVWMKCREIKQKKTHTQKGVFKMWHRVGKVQVYRVQVES